MTPHRANREDRPASNTCQCGHPSGDHHASTGPLRINWGPCYRCDCRQYTPIPREHERDAA